MEKQNRKSTLMPAANDAAPSPVLVVRDSENGQDDHEQISTPPSGSEFADTDEEAVDLTDSRNATDVASTGSDATGIANSNTARVEVASTGGGNAESDMVRAARPGPTSELENEQTLGLPSRFAVIELLGEGGMAHVYKARDTANDGKIVAIKILRPEIVPDPIVVERFFREAKAAQGLRHPNLVRVFDFGTTEQQMPYLIMEYVHGHNLAQIISEEHHLPPDRAINIFEQICHGLKAAHATGMVHRDLKPSNILVEMNADGSESVKIADFGIAKPPTAERTINPDLTKTGAILGSPAYMSPEQCLGHIVDERSDIYSLGCLMYEALTGRSPFASDAPVKSLIKHLEEPPEPFEIEFRSLTIPKGLEASVMKCLEKEPAKRFQRVSQLEEALIAPIDPGLRRRILAELIDLAVVIFGTMTLIGIIDPHIASFGLLARLGVELGITTLCAAAYYGFFESSKLQATPGKMITGLNVISSGEHRLGFWAAFLAPLAIMNFLFTAGFSLLLLSCFALCIPEHYSKFSSGGFGLGMLISIVVAYPLLFTNGRRLLTDFIFDRYVARPVRSSAPPRNDHLTKQIFLVLLSLFGPIFSCNLMLSCKDHLHDSWLTPVVCVKSTGGLKKGTVITKDMLVEIPTLPILAPYQPIRNLDSLVGRRASRDISAMDPVVLKDVEP